MREITKIFLLVFSIVIPATIMGFLTHGVDGITLGGLLGCLFALVIGIWGVENEML